MMFIGDAERDDVDSQRFLSTYHLEGDWSSYESGLFVEISFENFDPSS